MIYNILIVLGISILVSVLQKHQNKKPRLSSGLYCVVAERTGLEPATPCVTGRYSNQLNYRSTGLVLLLDILSNNGV